MSMFENPWAMMGLGLLAANQPGRSLGQVLGHGGTLAMQNMRLGQQHAQNMAEAKAKREALEAEAARTQAQRDYWKAQGGELGALGQQFPGVAAKVQAEQMLAKPEGTPEWQAKYQWLLDNPEKAAQLKEMGFAGRGPLVQVGGEPTFKVPANYMLKDPNDPSKGVVPIPGGPGEKRSGESAGKEAMIDVSRKSLPQVVNAIFKGGDIVKGDINRDVLFQKGAVQAGFPGRLAPKGQKLAQSMELGIQAITRLETGANMPPEEIENTRARFEPGYLDSDDVVRQKVIAYDLFMKNAKRYLDPNGKVNVDLALQDASEKMESDSESGDEVTNIGDLPTTRRGRNRARR